MENRKVLITGADGFVGRHLSELLNKRGFDCIGIIGHDLKADDPLLRHLTQAISMDLTTDVSPLLGLPPIKYVVHLASITPNKARQHGLSDKHSMELNAKMDANIVQFIKKSNIKRSILVSSCAVYAPSEAMLKENSPLGDVGGYAAGKRDLERLATDLVSDGHDAIIARPFNHSGPGQPLGFFIPDMVDKVVNKGSREAVLETVAARDFLDARDIASAYAELLEAPVLSSSCFNISSARATTTLEVLELISKTLQEKYGYTLDVRAKSDKLTDSVLGDNTRILTQTNWKPVIDLQKSVEDYIASTFV